MPGASGLTPYHKADPDDLVALRRLIEVTDRTNLMARDNQFWLRGQNAATEVQWCDIPKQTRLGLHNRTLFDRASILPQRLDLWLKTGETYFVTLIEGAVIIEHQARLTVSFQPIFPPMNT